MCAASWKNLGGEKQVVGGEREGTGVEGVVVWPWGYDSLHSRPLPFSKPSLREILVCSTDSALSERLWY